mgnify:CR=1 FL=1
MNKNVVIKKPVTLADEYLANLSVPNKGFEEVMLQGVNEKLSDNLGFRSNPLLAKTLNKTIQIEEQKEKQSFRHAQRFVL